MSILLERSSRHPGRLLFLTVALAPAVLLPHVSASRISFNAVLDRLDKTQEHAESEPKVTATASLEKETKKVTVDTLHDEKSLQQVQPHADHTSKDASTQQGESLQARGTHRSVPDSKDEDADSKDDIAEGKDDTAGGTDEISDDKDDTADSKDDPVVDPSAGKDSQPMVGAMNSEALSNHSQGPSNHSRQPSPLEPSHLNPIGYVSLIQARLASKMASMEEDANFATLAMFFGAASILLFLTMYCGCSSCMSKSKGPQRNVHKVKGRVVFEWDQSKDMANMYIKPPPGLDKNEFEITIEPTSLKVGRKGKAPFLKESFYDEVDVDRCSWKLRRNGELQIYLHKADSCEWPTILEV